MSTLGRAISIASKTFEDKLDKGGKPYILHCLYVMNEVKDISEEAMIIAVLHDLLEDSDWTAKMLYDEGFSKGVVCGVEQLTHRDEVSYDDYIHSVATNPICVKIKMADLRHNSDITRIKGVTKKDFDRVAKYHRSYEYLREI